MLNIGGYAVPFGRIVLAVAGLLAITSLFLPWTFATQQVELFSGWQVDGWVPLLLWTYPLVCLLFNYRMNKAGGVITGIICVALAVWCVLLFSGVATGTEDAQNSMSGVWLYLVANIVLLYGCVIDKEKICEQDKTTG